MAKRNKDALKTDEAMVTIGELAEHIGVATHVLRYWEKCFPSLQPLQLSGQRRYYSPEDVALVERIHNLLHVEGFTIPGAQRRLKKQKSASSDSLDISDVAAIVDRKVIMRWRDKLTEAL